MGARSVHLGSCPGLRGTVARRDHSFLPSGWSLPGAPRVKSCVILHHCPQGCWNLEALQKCPSSHIWRLLQRKCWFGERSFPSSRVGSLAFRWGGTCAVIWAARAPPPGSAAVRKCCACLPGGRSWRGASRASVWPRGWGPPAPVCPGVDDLLRPWRLLPSSRLCWPQAISPPRASVSSSSANWGQPSWLCCHLEPRNGLKREKRGPRCWVTVG